jgi:2-polyprenyl-3-methyl-5-hydroxy-6-metoxy-1,4-benzoquinol methylase
MRRVNPYNVGEQQDNYYIHLARYMFVVRQLKATDTLLEIGCGTGYGSRLLADHCKSVTGTDAAEELGEIWQKYDRANLQFTKQMPTDNFDVVVCFEVIEHIPEEGASEFLVKLNGLMKESGVAFISTPRALPFEQRSRNRQLEHPKEYSPIEFRQLLEKHFSRVFLFGQNDGIISTQNPEMAWNLVAICVK